VGFLVFHQGFILQRQIRKATFLNMLQSPLFHPSLNWQEYKMTISQSQTFIPISEAIRKYGVSKKFLLERIKSGKISSAKLPDGEYLVAENDIDPSLSIKREDFEHLRGQKISMSDASRKYGIPTHNLSRWAKTGLINILERGWKVLVDEADVAYCAAVYDAKYQLYQGKMMGVSIFDKDGSPYQVKYKDIATERRKQRRKRRELA